MAAPSARVTLTDGIEIGGGAGGAPRIGAQPGTLLEMITPSAPEASAAADLVTKKQLPRWISAILPATAGSTPPSHASWGSPVVSTASVHRTTSAVSPAGNGP